MRPYLKKPATEKGWWSGSKCRPVVQAPVPQKEGRKKKRKERKGRKEGRKEGERKKNKNRPVP
jgi:hypothetical protein